MALPAGYIELKYIKSTGTQYIDTGIQLKSITEESNKYVWTVEGDMAIDSPVDKTFLWSISRYQTSSSTTGFATTGFEIRSSQVCVGVPNAGTEDVSTSLSPSVSANSDRRIYGVRYHGVNWGNAKSGDMFYSKEVLSSGIPGDIIGSLSLTGKSGTGFGYAWTGNILIFAQKKINTIRKYCSATCYGFTITTTKPGISSDPDPFPDEEPRIVINLIPAKRISDDEVGMYDTVSGNFFTNLGSGSFIAGPSLSVNITATANPPESGTVTGSGEYLPGDTITLTATTNPSTNFEFREWTMNGEYYSSDNPLIFQATQDLNLVAEFRDPSSYIVNLFKDPSNAGGILTGAGDYFYGNSATLSYNDPQFMYRFKRWRDNSDPPEYIYDNPYNTIITGNLNLTAEVEKVGRCLFKRTEYKKI